MRVLALLAVAALALPLQAETLRPKQAVLDEFGLCVAKQSPDAAVRMMATAIGSPEEAHELSRLVGRKSNCLDGRSGLSMKSGAIRGAIAHALVLGDEARLARLRAMAASPAARAALVQGRAFVAGYAACLARAEPGKGLALISTPSGSADESAAFMAFGTALNDCMPEGAAYRVNIPDVRNHVADALFQMSGAPNA